MLCFASQQNNGTLIKGSVCQHWLILTLRKQIEGCCSLIHENEQNAEVQHQCSLLDVVLLCNLAPPAIKYSVYDFF